jgi:competence protein ComEC
VRLDAALLHRPQEEITATLEGRVVSVTRFPGWFRLDLGDVRCVDPGRARVPRRIRVQGSRTPSGQPALEQALPGDRLRVRLRLRAARERHNPGGKGGGRRLARAGIGAVGRPVHPALHARRVDGDGWRPLAPVHRLRLQAAERLRAHGRGGALLAALGLGERGGLSNPVRAAFADLGVAHLLAVSGLHLALVAGLCFAASRRLLVRVPQLAARCDVRLVALLTALVAAGAQALLAGWGVPVRRALVFLAASALAVARGRGGRRGQPLALAALGVLAFEPQALFEAGAQLSFAASAALILGARGAERSAQRPVLRSLDGLVRASATALLATAPLAALHLGVVAPFALVVNLLAVPWTGLVLLPLALLAALLTGLAPGLGEALLWVALPAAELTLAAVEGLAAHGLAPRAAPDPSLPGWGAILAVALGALRMRRTLARAVGALVVVLLLWLAPAQRIEPLPPRLVLLDVGQGDAVVVQGERGTVLVDGGPALAGRFDLGRSVVAPALDALGIDVLDLVVASHADLDHRGGLPAILEAFPARRLWLPRGGRRESDFAPLLEVAHRVGAVVEERGAGDPPASFGDLRVTPLWPTPAESPASRNDASLVVRVEAAGRSVLLAGDIGAGAERPLVAATSRLEAEVLLLPHHGSRTSSSAALLAAVQQPEVVLVSAPCGGRFGMPHAEVVERIRSMGVPLWWTGRDGAVLVGLGDRLVVRGWAPVAARCAPP